MKLNCAIILSFYMYRQSVITLNSCPSLLLNIINMVVCIIWVPGAAAVPDVQGPLPFSQCNLAGNATTLLTLLHYSYPLNCIWFHISVQQKKSPVYNIQSTWNGFTWMWLPWAESRCYLWCGSPPVNARHRIICHDYCLTDFQSSGSSLKESWSQSFAHRGNL